MSTQQKEQQRNNTIIVIILIKEITVIFIPVHHHCHRDDVNARSTETATRIYLFRSLSQIAFNSFFL